MWLKFFICVLTFNLCLCSQIIIEKEVKLNNVTTESLSYFDYSYNIGILRNMQVILRCNDNQGCQTSMSKLTTINFQNTSITIAPLCSFTNAASASQNIGATAIHLSMTGTTCYDYSMLNPSTVAKMIGDNRMVVNFKFTDLNNINHTFPVAHVLLYPEPCDIPECPDPAPLFNFELIRIENAVGLPRITWNPCTHNINGTPKSDCEAGVVSSIDPNRPFESWDATEWESWFEGKVELELCKLPNSDDITWQAKGTIPFLYSRRDDCFNDNTEQCKGTLIKDFDHFKTIVCENKNNVERLRILLEDIKYTKSYSELRYKYVFQEWLTAHEAEHEKDLKTAFQKINPEDFNKELKKLNINFSCSKFADKSSALAKYRNAMSIIYAKMSEDWQSSSTDKDVQDRLNDLKPGILDRYDEFINTILKGDYSQCP